MKNVPVANVRNVALMGHTGSGKTTLADALLYLLKVNDRKGSPETGTSMADWTEEERERKISVWAKPFDGSFKSGGANCRLVMLDSPGYADFVGQMISASNAADNALLVVDAVAGLQVGSNRAWRQCESLALPRAIVINGIDRDNADFSGLLASIQSMWGARCQPVTLPTADRKKVVPVFGGTPGDLADEVAEIRSRILEAVAETDDALLEKFLGGEELTEEEVAKGLPAAVAAMKLVPVFAVSAKADVGLTDLLDGLVRFFPAPGGRAFADTEGQPVPAGADAPFVGYVWRSINDPFVGQLSLVRVIGGTLKSDSEVVNVNKGQKERIGAILSLNGKKQSPVEEAGAGDIVAIPKLKCTSLSDTLAAPGQTVKLPAIAFPNPVMSYAVSPKTQTDEDKLAGGLHRVAEDDPTLRVERNTETHEQILSGMGDMQINVAVENMKKRSNVEVVLSTPKVAYKETITGRAEGHYKHKKQSGGRGQYGEVYLRVAPKSPDDPEWFEDAIVGGTIPRNFIPAVQKGLVEGLTRGALAGSPVINVKVTIYDGSYHDVDSSEVAFKIAGSRALRDGLSKAKPVLLEPIMKLKVMVPEQNMGDITGDLNHKRGRILGMGAEDGLQVITAEVPQAEVFQYSSQLRSMTGGRGSFELEFSRMDIVPSNIAQRIIAEAQKNKQEEE